MALSPTAWRWTGILGLLAFAGLLGFLVLVQGMLVAFDPFGHWQRPGIAKVAVTLVDRDEEGRITGKVWARQDGKGRTLRLAKEEAASLAVEDEVWILESYYAGGPRPDQFLLTPLRLLAEYPEPLLLLALWAARRLHHRQQRAEKEVPDIPRKVWKDEFHQRAARFEEHGARPPTDEPRP